MRENKGGKEGEATGGEVGRKIVTEEHLTTLYSSEHGRTHAYTVNTAKVIPDKGLVVNGG